MSTGGAAGRRIVVVVLRERETPRHFLQRADRNVAQRPSRVIAPRAERLTAQCALAKWVSGDEEDLDLSLFGSG